MGKIKYKQIYKHIDTNIKIKNSFSCNNCPNKIYNNVNKTVILGIGNICSDIMFILPNYDINANIKFDTILNLLKKVYNEITNKNIFEECYITRFIKCYNYSNYDIIEETNKNCINYLIYELNKLNIKNIIFCGNTFDNFNKYNNNYNILNNKNIYHIYSPGVLYYNNNNIQKIFYEQLKTILL